jgi:hypothetical protein
MTSPAYLQVVIAGFGSVGTALKISRMLCESFLAFRVNALDTWYTVFARHSYESSMPIPDARSAYTFTPRPPIPTPQNRTKQIQLSLTLPLSSFLV